MNFNKILLLFIDGSVNTLTKIGYGAYLAVYNPDLSRETLKSAIKVKHFENTTSSQLELQTLLWALDDLPKITGRIMIYTDSQTIVGLPERKDHLEKHNFRTVKDQPLRNEELYRTFYKIMDRLEAEIVKVKGHQPAKHQSTVDQLFSFVDRASRKAMKSDQNKDYI